METLQIQTHRPTEAFRFSLRRSTRSEHEALDAHPAFAELMGGTLDLAGYRRLMRLFHAFYARHDPVLSEACRQHGFDRAGFVYAPRRPVLASDLASLGVDDPLVLDRRMPLPVAPVGTPGALAGILYVLEGSLLGGSVLCRAVEALLERHGAQGHGYWQWCRAAGGARWAMTCSLLEDVASGDDARAQMTEGAKTGFAVFGAWLAGWREDVSAVGPADRDIRRC